MEVSILNKNNIENNDDVILIDKKIKLELGKNKELLFEITGNSISEADLKKVN